MPRRNDDPQGDLLKRIGRHNTGLSIDDVSVAVAGALKDQKRDLIAHMTRMIALERLSTKSEETRAHNLHARLTAVESEIRRLQKERSR